MYVPPHFEEVDEKEMIEECVGGTRHNFACGGWLLFVVDGCCVCVCIGVKRKANSKA